uniref:E3 ubiquitin-protein ligase KCMF1 n=1 Tax=Culex pipiens TaxID=7175 RepID=A0A8D8BYL4_CULPI
MSRKLPVAKVTRLAGLNEHDLDIDSAIAALNEMHIKINSIRKAAAEINCSVCSKKDIKWNRFVCLLCFNYNLCLKCYVDKESDMWHRPYHPIQRVLSEADFFKFRNGVVGPDICLNCPFCGRLSLSIADYLQHCEQKHGHENFTTRCSVCAAFGKPEARSMQFLYENHLVKHREPSKVLNCSTCEKSAFPGNRYTCLLCPEYTQCEECYQAKRQNFQHVSTRTSSSVNIFRCPFCGDGGFSANGLTNHCHKLHEDTGKRSLLSTVYCPICTVCQIINNQSLQAYSLLKEPLLDHLKNFHGLLPGAEDPQLEPTNCTICLLKLDAIPTKKYCRCSHNSFHDQCIRIWLVRVPTCPICRAHRAG